MPLLFTLQLFQSTHFENGKNRQTCLKIMPFACYYIKNIFNSIIIEIADMSEKNKMIKYTHKKVRR